MDFNETSEHQMLREAVGKLAAGFGHDYYWEKSKSGGRAHELWEAVSKAGFMGVNLPEQYGGGGMGMYELALVIEELAANGCPLLLMIVSPAICGSIIAQHGTDEQRQEWLPKICGVDDPRWKMAFAITEPDAGSNSHRLGTTAIRDGDEWVLNGSKYYISGMDESGAVLVVAKTGTDEKGKGKLSLFIVDTDSPGIDSTIIPVEISAPEKQYTVFFDNVRVPTSRLIGAEHEGLRQVFAGLNPERIGAASICTGIGRYAINKAAAYAKDRKVWDVPIGMHQGVSHPLAEAKIALEQARLMTQKAAWLLDTKGDPGEAANMAKFAGADAGIRCVDQAMQTHGGNGFASEYGLMDMWGMVRLLRTAPVSREMVLNFVAQHSLGLPKSY